MADQHFDNVGRLLKINMDRDNMSELEKERESIKQQQSTASGLTCERAHVNVLADQMSKKTQPNNGRTKHNTSKLYWQHRSRLTDFAHQHYEMVNKSTVTNNWIPTAAGAGAAAAADETHRSASDLWKSVRMKRLKCKVCLTTLNVDDFYFLNNCAHYFCKNCAKINNRKTCVWYVRLV